MTDLKNALEQALISEGTKAMMLKLAEESYRQGVNDTLETAKETVEKAVMLAIGKVVAAEREECAKVCENVWDSRTGLETGTALQCVDAIRARGESK